MVLSDESPDGNHSSVDKESSEVEMKIPERDRSIYSTSSPPRRRLITRGEDLGEVEIPEEDPSPPREILITRGGDLGEVEIPEESPDGNHSSVDKESFEVVKNYFFILFIIYWVTG